MAVTEDVIRLILETKGQGSVEDLQQSLEYTRATLGQLKKAYEAGEVSSEEFLKTGGKLARQERELADVLGAVEQAERDAAVAMKQATVEAERATIAAGKQADAQDKVADSTTKAGSKMAGFGQSALQTGRIMQDFAQGGIGGILNNLEGLAMALGLGSGVAGALTLLGVAFITFKPQIEEFLKSFKPEPVQDFRGAIETLQGRIKELTEKPHKLSIELEQLEQAKEQLDALKRGLDAFEAAKSGRTPDEQAAGAAFRKQFDEAGQEGAEAMDAVRRQMGEEAAASDPDVRAARKALADRERSQASAEQARREAEQRLAQARGLGDPDLLAQLTREAGAAAQEAQQFADPDAMAKLRDNVRKAVDDAKMKATAEVGNTFADVAKGNNPFAREAMADMFRAAGQDRFAAMVAKATPQAAAVERREKEGVDQAAGLDAHNAAQSKAGMDAIRKRENAFIDQLNAQGKEGEAAALRENREMLQEQEAAKKKGVARMGAAGKGIDAQAGAMTGLEAQAEAMIARAVAGGKVQLDAQGKMGGEDFAQLAGMIAQQIRASMPNINPLQATAVAGRVAANAEGDVGGMLAAQMGQGLDQTQAALQVVAQTQALVAQLAAKQDRINAGIGQLQRNNAQLGRQIRQPGNWNGNPMGGE